MRYPAKVVKEGKKQVAIFRFADGSECATEADVGESIEEMARDALVGRLKAYLSDGDLPPRPPQRAPRGALWVDVPMHVGMPIAVRWAREEAGLTQTEVALRMNVTQQRVAQLERPGSNPRLDTVEKLGRVLGVHLRLELPEKAGVDV